MADLQGPKIRVGKFDDGRVMLVNGAAFVLDASREAPGDIDAVGLDYKELPRDVKPGDRLLLNDGLIVLTVPAVRGEQVHTVVKQGGVLSNNKGINKQGGGLTAPALTAKDMEDIKTAMSFQADYLAVSFPKNATDMEMARQLANVAGEAHAPQAGADRQDRTQRGHPAAGGHPEGQRRHHGGARRPGGRGRRRGGAGAAKAHDPHGPRDGQDHHHRHADDGKHGAQPGAHARRGQRRGQRRARRHRCGDAQRRDRGRPIPGGNGRAHGADRAGGRARRGRRARRRLHQQALRPHRPDHRHGRAVHRLPPGLQGHRRADRKRLHRAVDEPAQHPRADLRR